MMYRIICIGGKSIFPACFDKVVSIAWNNAAPMPNYTRFTGCIRMPHEMSEKFFENVELGTPVIVD